MIKKGIWILILCFSIIVTSTASKYEPVNTHLIGFMELLLWQVREGSADNWAQLITPSGKTQSATIIDAPFKWRPGIRLGGQYSQSNRDAAIYYTGYLTHADKAAFGGVFSAFLGNFFADNTNGAATGPSYRNANINWDFKYHTLDIEIGHRFYIDQALSLHPSIGLKSAVINQTINSYWFNPVRPTNFNAAKEVLKNNFYGVGPEIGLNSEWLLSKHKRYSLYLHSDIAGALMWGHWQFKDHYTNDAPTSISINVNDITGAATMVNGGVGVTWSGKRENYEYEVSLRYEAQVWFNQMQFYSFNMGRLNHLMSLHGGVLKLSVSS